MKTKSYIRTTSNIWRALLVFAENAGIYSVKVIFGWLRYKEDENYTTEVGLNKLKDQAEKKEGR